MVSNIASAMTSTARANDHAEKSFAANSRPSREGRSETSRSVISEQRNPTASNLGKEARHAPSIEIVSCEVDHTNPSLEEFAREQAQRLIAQLAEVTACPVVIEALRQHPPGVCDATGRRIRFEILTGAPGRPEATAEHA